MRANGKHIADKVMVYEPRKLVLNVVRYKYNKLIPSTLIHKYNELVILDVADLMKNPENRDFIRKIIEIGYNPVVYGNKKWLKYIFDNGNILVDMTGCNTPDHNENVVRLLSKFEYDNNLKVTIVGSLAGLKMGGKKHPSFFYHKDNLTMRIVKILGILDEFLALSPAQRFERIKKILSDWVEFIIKPRVKLGETGAEGMALVNPVFAYKCGLNEGDKLVGAIKDRVHIVDDMWKLGADIIVSPDGNKLKLSEEKLSSLIGHSPSMTAEKHHSKMLRTIDKDGNIKLGRNPNIGLDLQATLGIKPQIDLTDIKRLLNLDIDEKMIRYFTFRDPDNPKKFKWTSLGKTLFVYKRWNTQVRMEYNQMVFKEAMLKLKFRLPGEFAYASPMYFAPKESKQFMKMNCMIRYSGGIPVAALAGEWEHNIYVDPDIWKALGGDYDGDLAFIIPLRILWKIMGRKVRLPDLEFIKKHYLLPEKDNSPDERTCEKETWKDNRNQNQLCGSAYNTGKMFIDACRMTGMTLEKLMEIETTCMALVEIYIHQFKRKINDTNAITFESLAERFGIYESIQFKDHVFPFFNITHCKGGILKIDRDMYEPLDALLKFAKTANPDSKSFNEQAVALFKDITPLSPEEAEVKAHNLVSLTLPKEEETTNEGN